MLSTGRLVIIYCLLFTLCYKTAVAQGGCLCLAVDTTESMGPEIATLQRKLPDIIRRRVEQRRAPDVYTLVSFNDPELGDLATLTQPFLFQLALMQLSASGGGDCADLVFTGLESVLDNCNSDCSVFVVTDSEPKDKPMIDSIISLILIKRMQVNFILTGKCGAVVDPVYYQVADLSLGLVIEVEKDNFSSVIPFIDNAIDRHEHYVLLAINRVPFPEVTRIVFDVIENTTVTEISLAGAVSEVNVYRREDDRAPFNLTTVVSTSLFKVFNLILAPPDTYLLELKAVGLTTVRVYGYSDSEFDSFDGLGDFEVRVLFESDNQKYFQPPLVATTILVETSGQYVPKELHQIEIVNYQNAVAQAASLVQANATMWRSEDTIVIPTGDHYARVLGRTFSGMDFAVYAFPAFRAVADPISATDGDPLFTVELSDKLSMCYAVHGDSNKVYNLISSPSFTVNSYFVTWPHVPNLNFHGKIGIRACHHECIVVSVENCELYVNGELYLGSVYQSECVEVIRSDDKITVSSRKGKVVEMVIHCHEIDGAKCLKFQVDKANGLEKHGKKPHGIIGQFYHQEWNYTLVPSNERTVYLLEIRGRKIPAVWDHKTWNRSKMPCFYVGDSQGGGVIDGHYSDYEVEQCSDDDGTRSMMKWSSIPVHCHLCNTAVRMSFHSEQHL